MLKLSYTEVGLYMEQIMTSLELFIAQRVVLAMRLGESLHVTPSQASFLLPADMPELMQLEAVLWREGKENITVIPVDDEYVEVSLCGSWVAASCDAHEGMFLAVIQDCPGQGMSAHSAELFVYKLWQMSQTHVSALV